MLKNQWTQGAFASLMLVLAGPFGVDPADAITITPLQDTLESLNLTFTSIPYPSTNDGQPFLVYGGQYWNLFTQRDPTLGPGVSFTNFLVQQVIPSGTPDSMFDVTLPTAQFGIEGRQPSSYTQTVSYLTTDSAGSLQPTSCVSGSGSCVSYQGGYRSVSCLSGSENCVFYTFAVSNNGSGSGNFQLQGFYQPDPTTDVPEPLTVAGALLALGLGAKFRQRTQS